MSPAFWKLDSEASPVRSLIHWALYHASGVGLAIDSVWVIPAAASDRFGSGYSRSSKR